MKSKKKKPKFTKAEIKEARKFENPDFIVSVSIITYEDLKKWNLIDSKTLRKHRNKKNNSDYEGGDVNE